MLLNLCAFFALSTTLLFRAERYRLSPAVVLWLLGTLVVCAGAGGLQFW